jgi:phage anti-repressor protein
MNNELNYQELETTFVSIIKSEDRFPVSFNAAWRWIGYARKDNAVKALLNNFVENADFHLLRNKAEQVSGAKHVNEYRLTTDCFKSFCMMAGTEKGKEVRQYYLKLEKAWNTPEAVEERAMRLWQEKQEKAHSTTVTLSAEEKLRRREMQAQFCREQAARARATAQRVSDYTGATYTIQEVGGEIGLYRTEFERWLKNKNYYTDYSQEGLRVNPSRSRYLIIKGYTTKFGYAGWKLLITATGREYFKQLFARFEYLLDNFQVPEVVEPGGDLFTA